MYGTRYHCSFEGFLFHFYLFEIHVKKTAFDLKRKEKLISDTFVAHTVNRVVRQIFQKKKFVVLLMHYDQHRFYHVTI